MSQPDQKYLLFSLQGKLFALDLAETAEVEDTAPLYPIPSLNQPYCGALHFHGRIVAVLDLAQLLQLPPCPRPDKTVILAPERADLAFQVERVLRIATADETTILTPAEHPLIIATMTLHDGVAALLDCNALVCAATAIIEG